LSSGFFVGSTVNPEDKMFEEMIKFGRELFMLGINNSHSGNMSLRSHGVIYITKHGARLGDLTRMDIVAVNLNDDTRDNNASIETKVHRAVYLANPDVRAIVHSHPPNAIALSLSCEKIVPVDMEGSYYLPEIPVLTKCETTISSDCVAENLPSFFSRYKVVVVKGHGTFAVGKTLEEAYMYTSVSESASRIIVLDKIARTR
jgi:L-fuculose-phosphate aldolase